MELELETAARPAPAPMPESAVAEESEIKLCRIDNPDCEACQ